MNDARLFIRRHRTGQAALATVFLIGSFIILIALTLAFLSISVVNSNRSTQSANRALSVASAGVQEGVLKLLRDNTANGTFIIDVNGNTTTVTIVNNVVATGQAVITSNAIINASQRSVQANISIVSSTGQLSVISWRQI